MAKMNKGKNEHHNIHALGEVLHHMEEGVVAAYDWLSGPAMSEKERTEHKLMESEPIRRTGSFGF
ncbi:MAG: hypothetical protein HQ475_00180 [SAR202 cluster bacterium]|nr:hypothetical protein [SAR202 cluster bacterium]